MLNWNKQARNANAYLSPKRNNVLTVTITLGKRLNSEGKNAIVESTPSCSLFYPPLTKTEIPIHLLKF